jgi:hypothetical protein
VRGITLTHRDRVVHRLAIALEQVQRVLVDRLLDLPVIRPGEGGVRGLGHLRLDVVAERDVAEIEVPRAAVRIDRSVQRGVSGILGIVDIRVRGISALDDHPVDATGRAPVKDLSSTVVADVRYRRCKVTVKAGLCGVCYWLELEFAIVSQGTTVSGLP